MSHPLLALPGRLRTRLFVPSLILTLLCMAVLQTVDAPLRTSAAPQGIVSFEFAGDVATTRSIVASWDERARIHAGFSLGFDFLFMPAYATTIALACLWAAGWHGRRRLAALGVGLAWGQWLAALFDAVENLSLWRLLLGGGAPWPMLAWWCALLKFALIGLGLLYAGVGLAAWFAARRAGPGRR